MCLIFRVHCLGRQLVHDHAWSETPPLLYCVIIIKCCVAVQRERWSSVFSKSGATRMTRLKTIHIQPFVRHQVARFSLVHPEKTKLRTSGFFAHAHNSRALAEIDFWTLLSANSKVLYVKTLVSCKRSRRVCAKVYSLLQE